MPKQGMRLIREHARERQIDTARIGVMGFSAGGHLAATLLTRYEATSRPAFGILFYPVISFDDRWAHRGSVQNLLGADSTETMKTYYSNELQVTPQTPPTLLLLSNNDGTVKPRNSQPCSMKPCGKTGCLPALYIFPSGGHGWGFRRYFRLPRNHEDTDTAMDRRDYGPNRPVRQNKPAAVRPIADSAADTQSFSAMHCDIPSQPPRTK